MPSPGTAPTLCIIGCGNLTRSDDGAGVVVARQLIEYVGRRPQLGGHVSVIDAGTGGMDVMFRARGASRLVIVDASRSGAEPGAIFEVPGAELEREHAAAYSLHDFRWEHALHAGRKIFREAFPRDVAVFLIEAGSLDFGLELTPPVREAVRRVAASIEAIVDRHVAA
jgi:hydrogenase maturation protease